MSSARTIRIFIEAVNLLCDAYNRVMGISEYEAARVLRKVAMSIEDNGFERNNIGGINYD